MTQNIARGAVMLLGFVLGLALPDPWWFIGILLIIAAMP